MHSLHIQKLKFNGQSVEKTKWKQTDRQTDRHTTDCFTLPANVVSNCNTLKYPEIPSINIFH